MSADTIIGLVYLAVIVASIAGLWKVFEKADKPGWGALIPIYNLYLTMKVAGRPGWWVGLYFLPLVSLIPAILVPVDIAKRFNKGTAFALGLIFLPFVFFPLLGFSDAEYQPDAAE